MTKKISVKERLRRNRQAGGGQPTKTVPVYLGADFDLVDQYERAVAELENPPEEQRGRRLDSTSGSKAALEARIADLRWQLAEFQVDFKLHALDDRRYNQLIAEHPPRKADDSTVLPADKAGWNSLTFPAALVRACVFEPVLDDEDWRELFGDEQTMGQLSVGQLDELAAAAIILSRRRVDIPFSPAASPKIPNS